MTERPIIFSAPMVCAILEGRKTQTRRLVKPKHLDAIEFCGGGPSGEPATPEAIELSYGEIGEDNGDTSAPQWRLSCADYPDEGSMPLGQLYGAVGDHLWVREAWAWPGEEGFIYRADTESAATVDRWHNDPNYPQIRWRPSIHMPRRASRITLEITGVRVERVQDISEADAAAEGIGSAITRDCKKPRFRKLWESIHSAESWTANPWVWVIEFSRVTP